MIYEDPEDYKDPEGNKGWEREIAINFDSNGSIVTSRWGLGPSSLRQELHKWWYQPFRHDIIENTLSADLIDYLRRDPQRLGIDRHIDQHLLDYYVLVLQDLDASQQSNSTGHEADAPESRDLPKRYRCAIDLYDHKRGTARVISLNDIFRLLDLRHEIHEKAVMHRVVQSANAMFSRALFLLGDGNKPKPADLVGLKRDDYALHGEDIFFQSVIERCTKPINNIQAQRLANGEVKTRRYIDEARRIFLKLIDRCVYRSLMIIPGDRAAQHFRFGVWPKKDDRGETEYDLRTLATIIDSAYYSSFLLFVSACVEKFLQEIFDTDDALCGHAQKIGDNNTPSALVEQAMQIVPSRVIIWTTPYKQLYKDPAVVVALDGWNGRIDDFVNNYSSTSTHNTSACNLVEASIQDADSKYAALWKLYVFISDGLFYTGILNKLKNCLDAKESEEDSVKRHELRLKRAQAFLIAAFEAVYEDWRNFCGTHNSVDDQRKHLEGSMSQERFKNLVCSWALTYQKAQLQENDPTSELSTVDVGHYAHGDPLQGDAGHNCRDIRYKMDRPAGDVWNRAKKKDAKSSEYKLVTFLEQVGVQNPNTISQEEFKQLAGLYDDEETRARCQEWLQKVPADLNP